MLGIVFLFFCFVFLYDMTEFDFFSKFAAVEREKNNNNAMKNYTDNKAIESE